MKLLITCLALSAFASGNGFALTEEEYRAKYPFPVDHVYSGSFEDDPLSQCRVYLQYGLRECEAEDGNIILLAFYDGKKLLRSYTLKQLFPDRSNWDFHEASGVFLWPQLNSKANGFKDGAYVIQTDLSILTFAVKTGNPVEPKKQNKAEIATPRKPSD